MEFLTIPGVVVFLTIPGFYLLLQGAGWIVDGAASIAKRFGIKSLVIGLTVVAFGTSAPELVVNLFACANECGDIALSNIIGSNIANILLVLGIAAIIFPLNVHHGTVWREIPLALLAVLVLGFLVHDTVIDGSEFSGLTRIDGLVLLSYLGIFLYYAFAIRKADPADKQTVPVHRHSLKKASLMTFGGIVALTLGGSLVVDGAIAITELFGLSQALIGATLIAIGTSLPELATTLIAAKRRDVDMAVGNAVGSNIFNVFWILGISAFIHPISFSPILSFDIMVAIVVTTMLFLVMFIGKRHAMERSQGVFFILLYVAYLAYIVVRG